MYSLIAKRRCFSPSADNSVQALRLDGQDETFGERVQIRTPRGESDWNSTATSEHLPETDRVQRIPVHDDISGIPQEAVERIGQIASHLLHPFFARLSRNANNLHFSCLQPHHEKNVVANDPYKCEILDGEEVQSGQGLPMCLNKSFPRCTAPSFRRRFDPMVIKNAFYRVSVHGDTKVEQRIPGRAPLILVYPQEGFSFAIRTARSAILSRVLGRPGPRLEDPSYFLATRFLNQRRSVSGVTIPANCSRVFLLSALAFTPNQRRCASVKRSRRPLKCSRYTRISSRR